MNINLNIITDLYKKTAIFLLVISIFSFIVLNFITNSFLSFSFATGCFILFLNVTGIFLIAKFSENRKSIHKDRIIFSSILFFAKLLFILALIFILIKFHLVNNRFFLFGLSLGFAIFFLANLIFLPVKIYKEEN